MHAPPALVPSERKRTDAVGSTNLEIKLILRRRVPAGLERPARTGGVWRPDGAGKVSWALTEIRNR